MWNCGIFTQIDQLIRISPTEDKPFIAYFTNISHVFSFHYQKTKQDFLEAKMNDYADTAERHVGVYDLLHILLITVSLPSTYICFGAIIIFQGHC